MSYGERSLEAVDLGRMRYADALRIQERLVEERKRGEGQDTLLFVEHPHVITMGRNGNEHICSPAQMFSREPESSFLKPIGAGM